jgi:hypothetical protein
MNLSAIARVLISTGIIILFLGLLLLAFSKLGLGFRLPGDIYIKKGNYSFYFPVVTCIVISLILTFILNFISRR